MFWVELLEILKISWENIKIIFLSDWGLLKNKCREFNVNFSLFFMVKFHLNSFNINDFFHTFYTANHF
jgi:hypothetical protein